MRKLLLPTFFAAALAVGCSETTTGAPTSASPDTTAAAGAKAKDQVKEQVSGNAEIGKPAPDFTLKDLDGKEHSLKAHRGKTVVLEWFNPGCPFVKNAHTKGSLKGYAASLG